MEVKGMQCMVAGITTRQHLVKVFGAAQERTARKETCGATCEGCALGRQGGSSDPVVHLRTLQKRFKDHHCTTAGI